MSALKTLFGFFLISGIGMAVLVGYFLNCCKPPPYDLPSTGYWGPKRISSISEAPKDDEQIYKFTIDIPQKTLDDLKRQLGESKFVEPVEDAKFHYGFNHNYLKQVVEYWRTKYDWRKEEALLNQYGHYKTQIEGIDIHFMHAKKDHPADVKVFPLMIIHGWPGSIVEFLDVIPMLTSAKNGVAFEVIAPSIPGYAFSEASHKQGLSALETGRIFVKLMKRLGFEKFFVQGGDWGGVIVPFMAQYFPKNILGMHSNMVMSVDLRNWRDMLYKMVPALVKDPEARPYHRCLPHPLKEGFRYLLTETGYMHLQATKPDTVGTALLNSPVGLAAYILEKFSTWTNRDYRDLEDGGLTKHFKMDRLLTNLMLYQLTGSIISSQRYYRENFASTKLFDSSAHPTSSEVPVGLSISPEELGCSPRFVAEYRYSNITTFTYHPRGGHFLAMEEPQLLADDVRNFVETVDRLYPRKLAKPTPFKFITSKPPAASSQAKPSSAKPKA